MDFESGLSSSDVASIDGLHSVHFAYCTLYLPLPQSLIVSSKGSLVVLDLILWHVSMGGMNGGMGFSSGKKFPGINSSSELFPLPVIRSAVLFASALCNRCTPQNGSTLEVDSAYMLFPQSPVSRVFRICLRGITTHIQTKEQTKTNQMTIYNSVGMSVHGCGMSHDWWLCMVHDTLDACLLFSVFSPSSDRRGRRI